MCVYRFNCAHLFPEVFNKISPQNYSIIRWRLKDSLILYGNLVGNVTQNILSLSLSLSVYCAKIILTGLRKVDCFLIVSTRVEKGSLIQPLAQNIMFS